jgi:hypothetical protein
VIDQLALMARLIGGGLMFIGVVLGLTLFILMIMA